MNHNSDDPCGDCLCIPCECSREKWQPLNSDESGTIGELRALLDKAGADQWAAEYDGMIYGGLADPDEPKRGREVIGRSHHYAPLIAALRNAAPELLRVVEAVSEMAEGDDRGCFGCDRYKGHEPTCKWGPAVAIARRMCP